MRGIGRQLSYFLPFFGFLHNPVDKTNQRELSYQENELTTMLICVGKRLQNKKTSTKASYNQGEKFCNHSTGIEVYADLDEISALILAPISLG